MAIAALRWLRPWRQRTSPARPTRGERDIARQQRKADLEARRLMARSIKLREAEAREQHRRAEAEAARRRDAETAAFVDHAFERHLEVRTQLQAVLARMRQPDVELSAIERDHRRALAHLWSADRQAIASLRRNVPALGSTTAADYESPSRELVVRLKREYETLRRQVGRALFVAESGQLGGYGCERRGDVFSEDTLAGYAALVALEDAAVLTPLRRAERPLVWEIGGGWGGFAYQLKTVIPNVTVVVSGVVEWLLVASTYLAAAFPHARLHFVAGDAGDWSNWQAADFIFVPEQVVLDTSMPRPQLVVDLAGMRWMTGARIDAHVRRAFELGATYVYVQQATSPRQGDRETLAALRTWYWPEPVPPRADRLLPVTEDGPADANLRQVPYAHIVGWRRVRP